MKKKILTALMLPTAMLLASCEFEHPEPTIYPDPIFGQSGRQTFSTNAIYEDYTTEISISRTHGISQEVTLSLAVDEALMDEYNQLYGADFTLLDAAYYSIPETVTIPATVKEINVPVTIHPSALVEAVGLEKANQTMLPIYISGSSVLTEESGSLGNILLTPEISKPEISVTIPETDPELSFIPTIPLTQNLTLAAKANFTTLDVSKIAYKPALDKVEEYNAAHGTDYDPLPADTYTILEDVFDSETLEVSSSIIFDCAKIGGTGTYLLPLELTQTGEAYDIVNAGPVYVIIRLTELKISMANGGLETTLTGKGTVKVNLNAPMSEEQPVNLTYDASKVDDYNSTNGTDYKTLDASKVQVTATAVPAGNTSCEVAYTIDILDLPYDEDKYLVPLTIDASVLVPGTIVEEPSTVYIEVNKSLAGNYFMETWTSVLTGTQDKSNEMNSLIFLCSEQGKNPSNGQKYYFNYNKSWSDGIIFFDISDEPMPGHENCVRLINFQDRDPAQDPIPANESYLNLVTGEIVIDFIIESYWAPEPTEEGQIKGELRCVRLTR